MRISDRAPAQGVAGVPHGDRWAGGELCDIRAGFARRGVSADLRPMDGGGAELHHVDELHAGLLQSSAGVSDGWRARVQVRG